MTAGERSFQQQLTLTMAVVPTVIATVFWVVGFLCRTSFFPFGESDLFWRVGWQMATPHSRSFWFLIAIGCFLYSIKVERRGESSSLTPVRLLIGWLCLGLVLCGMVRDSFQRMSHAPAAPYEIIEWMYGTINLIWLGIGFTCCPLSLWYFNNTPEPKAKQPNLLFTVTGLLCLFSLLLLAQVWCMTMVDMHEIYLKEKYGEEYNRSNYVRPHVCAADTRSHFLGNGVLCSR